MAPSAGIYKTSCKSGEGVEEMFTDIAKQLAMTNRSRIELQAIEVSVIISISPHGMGGHECSHFQETSFQVAFSVHPRDPSSSGDGCSC